MNLNYFNSLTSLREKVMYLVILVRQCRKDGIHSDDDIRRVIKVNSNNDELVMKILDLALNQVK